MQPKLLTEVLELVVDEASEDPMSCAISHSHASPFYPVRDTISSAALSSGLCSSSRDPPSSSTRVHGFLLSSGKCLSSSPSLEMIQSQTSVFLTLSLSISSPDFRTCVHGKWRQKTWNTPSSSLHWHSTTLPSGVTGNMVATSGVWSYHLSSLTANRTSEDSFQHSPTLIASPVTASGSIQGESSPS